MRTDIVPLRHSSVNGICFLAVTQVTNETLRKLHRTAPNSRGNGVVELHEAERSAGSGGDGQGEGLGGGGTDAIAGGEGKRVATAGAGCRSSAQCGSPVAVVLEGDTTGQGTGLGNRGCRGAGGSHGETPRCAHRECRAAGAGERRWRTHRQREGLSGWGAHAVAGSESERVGAARAGCGSPAQRGAPG